MRVEANATAAGVGMAAHRQVLRDLAFAIRSQVRLSYAVFPPSVWRRLIALAGLPAAARLTQLANRLG
eukprot:9056425-Lingulodinium_polyedra.AAC.1